MQDGDEILGEIAGTLCFQGHPAISEVDHAVRKFDALADQRVGVSLRQGNSFPSPAICLLGRRGGSGEWLQGRFGAAGTS